MAATRAFEAHTGKLPPCIFRHWHVVKKRDQCRSIPRRERRDQARAFPRNSVTAMAATRRPKPSAMARRRHPAGPQGAGPARVTTPPGKGKKRSPSTDDLKVPRSCCHTGRRTGAGTRAIRSHLPRRASLYQRHPAAPPSTRVTHRRQKSIIKLPRVGKWCHVPAVGDGYRSASGHTPLCLPKKRRTSLYEYQITKRSTSSLIRPARSKFPGRCLLPIP